jgi:hypothetical protein
MPVQLRHTRWPIAVALAVGAVALWLLSGQGPDDAEQWALIDRYCSDCHNDIEFAGEVAFEGLTPDDIFAHPETFETAVRKLRGNLMPPPGNPRPDLAEVDSLIAWLENALDQAAEMPRAGHVPVQRLSRTEYAAAVQDLLAVAIDPAEYLPTEIEIDGFTNMAAALSTSPAFLEQYLSVARATAKLAVGQAEPKLSSVYFPPPPQDPNGQDGHTDGLPLGTRGGTRFMQNFPADGEYHVKIMDLDMIPYSRSLETEHTVVILIDREEVFREQIGGLDDLMLVNRGGAPAVAEIMKRFADIPVVVTAGDHEVVVTFIERSQAATDGHIFGFVPYGGFSFTGKMRVPRLIGGIEVVGPFDSTGVSRTPSREKLFVCVPEVLAREQECAERITSNLARRAFRRPVDQDDIERLMPFFETGRKLGGSFDAGIEQVVAAVLASPDFLYRSIDPPANETTEEYRLSELELASRLSFFLWGRGPDDELLELASNGQLDQPGILDAQVGRMLLDPRAETLVSGFALHWLNLDDLTAVDPDSGLFPDFSEALREDFATEIELFLKSILLEDRDVRELLSAEHTFLNDRLAAHYGISGIYGPQFRRVELDNAVRYGLLGKAAVLLRTSYGDRTSPVLRGAWVLEKLMGTPPTPPPPNVETDLTTPEGEQPKTIRIRLEQHRAAPNCNGCHGVIDPYGIALENFTAIGEWRDVDRAANSPIDAATVLPNGMPLEGPIDLRQALLQRPDQFVQALTEKLMMYALGRELEYHDMRQVRRIVSQAAESNYTMSAIVAGIAASDAFRMQARPHEE